MADTTTTPRWTAALGGLVLLLSVAAVVWAGNAQPATPADAPKPDATPKAKEGEGKAPPALAPGEATVEVRVLPPENYKINGLAPNTLAFELPEGHAATTVSALKVEKKALSRFFRLKVKAEETLTVRAAGEVFVCTLDETQCLPPKAVEVPVVLTVKEDGTLKKLVAKHQMTLDEE